MYNSDSMFFPIVTKYNIGDNVWILIKGKPCRCSVKRIVADIFDDGPSIRYYVKPDGFQTSFNVGEEEISPTKEELLDNINIK